MKSHWRKASLIAVAVSLFAGLAPTLAGAAAPTITSVVPYGNIRPSEFNATACAGDVACLAQGPSSLFANSQPRAKYQKGLLWITGNATPGSFIDVTVAEGINTATTPATPAGRAVRQTYTSATTAVPEFGIVAGDFVESGDVPSINVTDLGTHWAGLPIETPAGSGKFVGACSGGATAAGCDPTTQLPANWGPSTLYIFVQARNPSTGETSDPFGAPAVPTITKYAGTPVGAGQTGDKANPSANRQTWPPRHWCHLSSQGPRGGGQDFGGRYDGTCSRISDNNFGAAPDVSWLIFGCYPRDRTYYVGGIGDVLIPNPWPTQWTNAACPDGGSRVPTGQVGLTGTLNDDVSSGLGIASEMADVNIEVLLGALRVKGPFHGLVRNGPQAGYSQNIGINDLEPNYMGPGPLTTPYTAKVTYFDAWGNSNSASSQFTIYPW